MLDELLVAHNRLTYFPLDKYVTKLVADLFIALLYRDLDKLNPSQT